MTGPRIATLDIETFPTVSAHWGMYDQNIALNQIVQEWSIASYCVKWYGSKELIYQDTSGRGPKKVRDDSKLLTGLHAILDSADIIIAQNGKKFDLPKINARLIMVGYKAYSPVRVIDTVLEARKIAAFTSNKLEWLSTWLTDTPKGQHKKFPGFELWTECLNDNPAAWAEMKKYNMRDVVATEKVYKRLQSWITSHPNLGAYTQEGGCPKCSSKKVQQRGFAVTQQGKYARFQCQDCGGWHRGKANLLDKHARKGLGAN